jgi:hypothetical protein
METKKIAAKPRPVITQTENNTTLWIGHLQTDPTDHFGGQTFSCPVEGELDNIQVYSSAVPHGGEMTLTFHSFDAAKKTWGPSIATASVKLERKDAPTWIRFELKSVNLNKHQSYGFRLHAKDALVAIGEAATVTKQPFANGEEWHGDSKNQKGQFYKYFSLAYKVEMCA